MSEFKSNLPEILTVKETAYHLRVGLNSTYNLLRHGTLKSVRVGRQYRIPRQAILEYMHLNTSC